MRRLKAAHGAATPPVTHGGVVGQVWRGRGPRSALLARALEGIEVRGLDEALGRAAGELLGTTGQSDAADPAVVLLARDGGQIVTSDAADLLPLAEATGRLVELVPA